MKTAKLSPKERMNHNIQSGGAGIRAMVGRDKNTRRNQRASTARRSDGKRTKKRVVDQAYRGVSGAITGGLRDQFGSVDGRLRNTLGKRMDMGSAYDEVDIKKLTKKELPKKLRFNKRQGRLLGQIYAQLFYEGLRVKNEEKDANLYDSAISNIRLRMNKRNLPYDETKFRVNVEKLVNYMVENENPFTVRDDERYDVSIGNAETHTRRVNDFIENERKIINQKIRDDMARRIDERALMELKKYKDYPLLGQYKYLENLEFDKQIIERGDEIYEELNGETELTKKFMEAIEIHKGIPKSMYEQYISSCKGGHTYKPAPGDDPGQYGECVDSGSDLLNYVKPWIFGEIASIFDQFKYICSSTEDSIENNTDCEYKFKINKDLLNEENSLLYGYNHTYIDKLEAGVGIGGFEDSTFSIQDIVKISDPSSGTSLTGVIASEEIPGKRGKYRVIYFDDTYRKRISDQKKNLTELLKNPGLKDKQKTMDDLDKINNKLKLLMDDPSKGEIIKNRDGTPREFEVYANKMTKVGKVSLETGDEEAYNLRDTGSEWRPGIRLATTGIDPQTGLPTTELRTTRGGNSPGGQSFLTNVPGPGAAPEPLKYIEGTGTGTTKDILLRERHNMTDLQKHLLDKTLRRDGGRKQTFDKSFKNIEPEGLITGQNNMITSKTDSAKMRKALLDGATRRTTGPVTSGGIFAPSRADENRRAVEADARRRNLPLPPQDGGAGALVWKNSDGSNARDINDWFNPINGNVTTKKPQDHKKLKVPTTVDGPGEKRSKSNGKQLYFKNKQSKDYFDSKTKSTKKDSFVDRVGRHLGSRPGFNKTIINDSAETQLGRALKRRESEFRELCPEDYGCKLNKLMSIINPDLPDKRMLRTKVDELKRGNKSDLLVKYAESLNVDPFKIRKVLTLPPAQVDEGLGELILSPPEEGGAQYMEEHRRMAYILAYFELKPLAIRYIKLRNQLNKIKNVIQMDEKLEDLREMYHDQMGKDGKNFDVKKETKYRGMDENSEKMKTLKEAIIYSIETEENKEDKYDTRNVRTTEDILKKIKEINPSFYAKLDTPEGTETIPEFKGQIFSLQSTNTLRLLLLRIINEDKMKHGDNIEQITNLAESLRRYLETASLDPKWISKNIGEPGASKLNSELTPRNLGVILQSCSDNPDDFGLEIPYTVMVDYARHDYGEIFANLLKKSFFNRLRSRWIDMANSYSQIISLGSDKPEVDQKIYDMIKQIYEEQEEISSRLHQDGTDTDLYVMTPSGLKLFVRNKEEKEKLEIILSHKKIEKNLVKIIRNELLSPEASVIREEREKDFIESTNIIRYDLLINSTDTIGVSNYVRELKPENIAFTVTNCDINEFNGEYYCNNDAEYVKVNLSGDEYDYIIKKITLGDNPLLIYGMDDFELEQWYKKNTAGWIKDGTTVNEIWGMCAKLRDRFKIGSRKDEKTLTYVYYWANSTESSDGDFFTRDFSGDEEFHLKFYEKRTKASCPAEKENCSWHTTPLAVRMIEYRYFGLDLGWPSYPYCATSTVGERAGGVGATSIAGKNLVSLVGKVAGEVLGTTGYLVPASVDMGYRTYRGAKLAISTQSPQFAKHVLRDKNIAEIIKRGSRIRATKDIEGKLSEFNTHLNATEFLKHPSQSVFLPQDSAPASLAAAASSSQRSFASSPDPEDRARASYQISIGHDSAEPVDEYDKAYEDNYVKICKDFINHLKQINPPDAAEGSVNGLYLYAVNSLGEYDDRGTRLLNNMVSTWFRGDDDVTKYQTAEGFGKTSETKRPDFFNGVIPAFTQEACENPKSNLDGTNILGGGNKEEAIKWIMRPENVSSLAVIAHDMANHDMAVRGWLNEWFGRNAAWAEEIPLSAMGMNQGLLYHNEINEKDKLPPSSAPGSQFGLFWAGDNKITINGERIVRRWNPQFKNKDDQKDLDSWFKETSRKPPQEIDDTGNMNKTKTGRMALVNTMGEFGKTKTTAKVGWLPGKILLEYYYDRYPFDKYFKTDVNGRRLLKWTGNPAHGMWIDPRGQEVISTSMTPEIDALKNTESPLYEVLKKDFDNILKDSTALETNNMTEEYTKKVGKKLRATSPCINKTHKVIFTLSFDTGSPQDLQFKSGLGKLVEFVVGPIINSRRSYIDVEKNFAIIWFYEFKKNKIRATTQGRESNLLLNYESTAGWAIVKLTPEEGSTVITPGMILFYGYQPGFRLKSKEGYKCCSSEYLPPHENWLYLELEAESEFNHSIDDKLLSLLTESINSDEIIQGNILYAPETNKEFKDEYIKNLLPGYEKPMIYKITSKNSFPFDKKRIITIYSESTATKSMNYNDNLSKTFKIRVTNYRNMEGKLSKQTHENLNEWIRGICRISNSNNLGSVPDKDVIKLNQAFNRSMESYSFTAWAYKNNLQIGSVVRFSSEVVDEPERNILQTQLSLSDKDEYMVIGYNGYWNSYGMSGIIGPPLQSGPIKSYYAKEGLKALMSVLVGLATVGLVIASVGQAAMPVVTGFGTISMAEATTLSYLAYPAYAAIAYTPFLGAQLGLLGTTAALSQLSLPTLMGLLVAKGFMTAVGGAAITAASATASTTAGFGFMALGLAPTTLHRQATVVGLRMTAGAVGTVLDRSYDATGRAVTMVQRPFSNQAANTELLENHRGMLETFNNQDLSDKTLSKSDEITLAKRLSHTASVYDPKNSVPEPLKYFTYQTGDPYMPGRVVNGIEVHLQKLGQSSDSEKFVTLSIPFTTKTNKGYYDIRKGHQTLEGDKSKDNALIHSVDKCKSELLTKILPVYNLSTIREIFNDIDKLTPNTDNLDQRVREYKKIMYNYCREYLVRIQANDPLDIPRDTNKLYNSVESELYDMIDISEMKMKRKPPSMNIYENDRQIMINIMQGVIITLLTNNYKEYDPSNSTWGRNKTINESDRALEAIDENKSLIYNASNRIHFHKYKNIKRLLDGKRGYTYKDNIKILSWMPQARQTHDIFIGILGAAKDPTKVNKIITGIEACKKYTEDVQDVGLDLLERIRQLENIENSLTELLKYVEIKLHNDHSLHSENILPIMKIDLTNDKDYTIGDLIGELNRRDPSESRNYGEYIKNLNEAYDSIGEININNLALDSNYINRYSAISDHNELFNIFEETNPEEDGIKKVKIKSLFINQDYIDSVGEYLKNTGKPAEETDAIMSKLGEINKSTNGYYTEDKLKIKIGTKILFSTMNYSEKTKFKNKDGGAECLPHLVRLLASENH